MAAELVDAGTANDILEEWRRTLEAEGFQRREAVGFGFHGLAEVTTRADRLGFSRSDEPDRVVRADGEDGWLGAYTLRFRPAVPRDAQELTLTVGEDSKAVAQVSLPIPSQKRTTTRDQYPHDRSEAAVGSGGDRAADLVRGVIFAVS